MIDKIRILVIDDSAFNRRTIIKMLESIPGIEVVDYACDGEEGLRKVFDLKPDLITLDLEMPRLDGFSFLRIVMQNRPTPVIVVSARSDNENVFKALEFGAVDFVSKPSSRISPELFNIRDDLVSKIHEAANANMLKVLKRAARSKDQSDTFSSHSRVNRGTNKNAINHVVIGASTGGPPALQAIFSNIKNPVDVFFAVSQHMPPGFTKAFADRLNKYCPLEIKEAEAGDIVRSGRVLIAPGGKNLEFRRHQNDVVAVVSEARIGQRYVPSVDIMFNSAAKMFGSDLLGVVLTGMGNDGALGTAHIKEHGGLTLAESEDSSVVFGMPKEAIATGKVDWVKPLARISEEILSKCGY